MTTARIEELRDRLNGASINTAFELTVANILDDILRDFPTESPAAVPAGNVRMRNLCFTDKTLYGVDQDGRVWFIEMKTGQWELHGNPGGTA